MQRLVAFALGALATGPAVAAMSCADLGAYLAVQPHVSQVNATTPLTTIATTGGTRCEANFVYSARGGIVPSTAQSMRCCRPMKVIAPKG